MKTRLLVFIGLLCLSFTAQAQILWDKTYGTATTNQGLTRMIALGNGGYLLVGNQETSNSPTTITTASLVIRTNANGDTIWTRKFMPAGWNFAVINDAAEDHDGNLILVGSGYVNSPTFSDGLILKLNPVGDTIWTRKLVTPQNDRCINVIIGNDSSYIVNCREFNVPVIQKINKNGQTMWVRTVAFSPTDPGFINNLSKTQNGYFVFAGTNAIFPSMGKIVKLNEAGIEQQSHFNFAVAVYDVFTKPNFNMLACSGVGIYEYNAIGDTLWSKKYVMNTRPLWFTSAKPTLDGNYITVFDRSNGNDGDVGLMKIAPDGTIIKDTLLFRFGYNEVSKDIVVDANGDYVFAGHAQVAGNKSHMFLAKLRKWNQTLGLKEDLELASAIKLYPNPATEQTIVTSEKPLSGTLTLYDLQGQQVWQKTVLKTAKKVIPLQNLPPGIYILRFVSESGASFSHKIIKQ